MLEHQNCPSGKVPNGNWQDNLTVALQLARHETTSKEILKAVNVLEKELAKREESVHTVSILKNIPVWMCADFFFDHLEYGDEVKSMAMDVTNSKDMVFKISAQGTRDKVIKMAEEIFSNALMKASEKVCADVTFLGGSSGFVQQSRPNSNR